MVERDVYEIGKSNEEVPAKNRKCAAWERRTMIERCLFFICILFIVVFIIMTAFIIHHKNPNIIVPPKESVCLTSVCMREAGRILHNMDITVDPCEDFYNFTCGSYLKYKDIYSDSINANTDIKGHIAFMQKELLENSEEEDPSYVEKIKQYYKSCMNLKETVSVKEILDDFLSATQVNGWPFTKYPRHKYSQIKIEEIMAKAFIYEDTGIFFTGYPIYKNDSLQHLKLLDGYGPIYEEGYLNNTDEYTIQLKQKYINLFKYVLIRIGLEATDIKEIIDEIISLETSLAKIRNKETNRNVTILTIKNMEHSCSQIEWTYLFRFLFEYMDHSQNYYDDIQLKVINYEIVMEICQLVGKTDHRIIYNTIIWNIFIHYLYQLDPVFRQLTVDEQFGISFGLRYSKPSAAEHQKWKACIKRLQQPFSIGLEYYLLEHLQVDENIKEVENYIKQVMHAMEKTFTDEEWLDDFSKAILKSKLSNIKYRIGFGNSSIFVPMLVDVFTTIKVGESYIQNFIETDKYKYIEDFFNGNLSRLISHTDLFNVFVVNAYYREGKSLEGYITIPLGIIQPPYFSYGAPHYLNFGGIGTTIGHELSHGFDNLKNLQKKVIFGENEYDVEWSKEFIQGFKNRRNCLINQYSNLLPGKKRIALDESIGEDFSDNSGVVQSFRAYEMYLEEHGEEPKLPGLDLTNKQMFFIGFAQKQCEKLDTALSSYTQDSHNPFRYRTLIPLMNFAEFSNVFNCPANTYMNPDQKCRTWG